MTKTKTSPHALAFVENIAFVDYINIGTAQKDARAMRRMRTLTEDEVNASLQAFTNRHTTPLPVLYEDSCVIIVRDEERFVLQFQEQYKREHCTTARQYDRMMKKLTKSLMQAEMAHNDAPKARQKAVYAEWARSIPALYARFMTKPTFLSPSRMEILQKKHPDLTERELIIHDRSMIQHNERQMFYTTLMLISCLALIISYMVL